MEDSNETTEEKAPSMLEEMAHNYSLTDSEKRAVIHLCDELDWSYSKLKRNPKGLDFEYNGNLGIEVKSSKSYRLSINQLEDTKNYDITIVIISKPSGCWVDRIIDCVEFIRNKDDAMDRIMKAVRD